MRNGLLVAKSLGLPSFNIGQSSTANPQYNWLLNEDETPRDRHEKREMALNFAQNRKNKYMEPSEDQLTAANSNFVV